MRIQLTNFRKYESKTFEFPDTGTILIHGKSGIGKTTIFKAIYFALYGRCSGVKDENKENKNWSSKDAITKGKKKCEVSLEYKNIKVIRRTNPNVLIVIQDEGLIQHDLSGEDAQQFINTEFGKYFEYTSYFKQHDAKSFLTMPAGERLKLMQHFSGIEESIGMKEKLKTLQKEKKIEQKNISCTLEILRKRSPENVKKPLDVANICVESIKETETELDTERKKLDYFRVHQLEYEKFKNRKMIREREIQRRKEIEMKFEDVDETVINSLKNQISEMTHKRELYNRYKEVEYARSSEIIKKKINMHEDFKKLMEINSQIIDLEKKCVNEPEPEILQKNVEQLIVEKNRRKKIRSIKSKLPQECPQTFKELEEKITELEKCLLSSISQKCPKCGVSLYITQDKKLAISNVDVVQSVPHLSEIKIQQQLDSLIQQKPRLAELESLTMSGTHTHTCTPEDISNIERQIQKANRTIEMKKGLNHLKEEKNKINPECKDYTNSTDSEDSLQSELRDGLEKEKILGSRTGSDFSSGDILLQISEDTINELNETLQVQLSKKKDQKSLHEQYSSILKCIPPEEKVVSEVPECEIKKTEEKITTLVCSLKTKRKQHEDFVEYSINMKKYEEFVRYSSDVEKLTQSETQITHELGMIGSIQQKIYITETESLNKTISFVNSWMDIYVEKFFKDCSVSATIQPFKNLQSGEQRTEVNVSIEYNGEIVDTTFLSEGELNRLELAIHLALNRAFGTKNKILLLDEALSSLDSENTRNVMECLKYFSDDNSDDEGKVRPSGEPIPPWAESNFPILVIEHQAIAGMFDTVIDLTDSDLP